MKPIGIVYQPRVPQALPLAEEMEAFLGEQGVPSWKAALTEDASLAQHRADTWMVMTLGGDGSLLRVARVFAPACVPLVGVNLGQVGFMTELRPEELRSELPRLLRGEGWMDERLMLQVSFKELNAQRTLHTPSGRTFAGDVTLHALNDILVGRGALARVVRVEASLDGEPLASYIADGVLVATPTGSTGYAVAISGPILHPQVEALVLKPVSPHLTFPYALVLPASCHVELTVHTTHQVFLSVDGQIDLELQDGDRLVVQRSPYQARFLRLRPPGAFYRDLAQRLRR